jgi:hypothetical protein
MARRAVKHSRKPLKYTGVHSYSPQVTRELFERLLPYVGWPGMTPVITALAVNRPMQPDDLENAVLGLNTAIMTRLNAEEPASDVAELMFLQRALLGLISPFGPYIGEANPGPLNAGERGRIAADLTDYMLGTASSRLQQRVSYQKFRPALRALLTEYIENPSNFDRPVDAPELLYSKTSKVTGDTVRIVHEVDGTFTVEYTTGDTAYLKERQTFPAACNHYCLMAALMP